MRSLGVRLEWETKPTEIERLSLPFQTVERINESGATRDRDAGSLFGGQSRDDAGRNQLIWGDNKLVMSGLVREFAGEIRLTTSILRSTLERIFRSASAWETGR